MGAGEIRAGEAVVEISGDDSGLRASLQRALGKFEAFEKRLKDSFGGRGPLGDFFDILRGGGAVLGLGLAARTLDDMATAAVELEAKFREGNLSVGEMTSELAKAVPILGTLVSAGEKFGRVIGDTAAFEASMNRLEEVRTKVGNAQIGITEGMQKAAKEFATIRQQIDDDMARRRANPFELAAMDAAKAVAANRASLAAPDATADAAIKQAEDGIAAADAEIAKQRARMAELRAWLSKQEFSIMGAEKFHAARAELSSGPDVIAGLQARQASLRQQIDEMERSQKMQRAAGVSQIAVDEFDRAATIVEAYFRTVAEGFMTLGDVMAAAPAEIKRRDAEIARSVIERTKLDRIVADAMTSSVFAAQGPARALGGAIDGIAAGMQGANEFAVRGLQAQLRILGEELRVNQSGSVNFNPALIDPAGVGDSPEVQAIKDAQREIIKTIESLVAQ